MADLKIKISTDTSGMSRGIGSAKNKLNNLAGSVKRIATSSFAAAVTAFITGAGIAAAALVKMKNAIDPIALELDNLAKSSKRIGITTEAMQKLNFAAQRTGASIPDVESAFKRMQRGITDAGKGMSSAQKVLAALALSYKDIEKLSPEEQFATIAERLSLVENATKKAAIAQEIFGRAGTKLLPMMIEYKELSHELQNIGGIIDEKQIAAAERYNDAILNLVTSLKAAAANSGALQVAANAATAAGATTGAVKRDGFFKSAATFVASPIAGVVRLMSKTQEEAVGQLAGNIVSKVRDSFTKGMRQIATGTTLEEEVKKASDAFTANNKGTKAFTITPPSDSMLSIGGHLAARTGGISTAELTELQKQTELLRNLNDNIRVSDLNATEMEFLGDVQRFIDGA